MYNICMGKPIRIFSEQEIQDICNFYIAGGTIKTTARKFNTRNHSIMKLLRVEGVEVRTRGGQFKYFCDDNFL